MVSFSAAGLINSNMARSLLQFDITTLIFLVLFCLMAFLDINIELTNFTKRRNLFDTSFLRGETSKTLTMDINGLTYHHVDKNLKWKDREGIAIVMLVSSQQEDVDNACTALMSLSFLDGDASDHPAHVLIFNEEDLSQNQTDALINSTDRTIAFPLVDLKTLPDGLEIEAQDRVADLQITRFWITGKQISVII